MITLNGTTGITNDGGYTGDGVVFADTTPANTLVTTTGGNVGIGTSLPSYKLDITGQGRATTGFAVSTDGSTFTPSGLNAIPNYGIGYITSTSQTAISGFGGIPFYTNQLERARIDSSGNLLVGTTSQAAQERLSVATTGATQAALFKNNDVSKDTIVAWSATTSGTNQFVGFYTEAGITARGSITYNRGAGLTAYNTTSDYRAKDISGPISDALQTVAQLKPYMGTMKGATVERPMFVAHEAQVPAPYCVTGEKDAVNEAGEPVFQQMDHSTLVPLLTAAIQEQQAIILAQESALNALTARVAALEGTTNV